VIPLINLVIICGARLDLGICSVATDSREGGEIGKVAASLKEIESTVVGMVSVCIGVGVSTGQ
jgi:hypothetical protein